MDRRIGETKARKTESTCTDWITRFEVGTNIHPNPSRKRLKARNVLYVLDFSSGSRYGHPIPSIMSILTRSGLV